MSALTNYILHNADSTLILTQRNGEWCGHGPILEQDIAITNITLDLIGQSRNFYQYAAELMNGEGTAAEPVTEDDLAYLRKEREFKNFLITELPNGDWAQTILRQFFFSSYQQLLYTSMQTGPDERLAGIAAKALKEVNYHVTWSTEWVIRLADGTEESNRRMKNALQFLWPYTGEFFIAADYEKGLISNDSIKDPASFRDAWMNNVSEVFSEAGLLLPADVYMHEGGKTGVHTEHLGFLLTELQYLQRTYPGAEW